MTTTLSASLPAILGGTPAVQDHDPATWQWPIITEQDEQAVLEVLRSGELSLHSVTRDLEEDYRRRWGHRHAVAYCNATSAIFAAFQAFGLQPGDEVLVPSATYWASVVPMLWAGAVPIFCESETRFGGLDPEDVRRKVTPRAKALVIVPLWGMPSRMDELTAIARENDLLVLEDASHAHGASFHGKPIGTFGDISVFSLQTNKLAPAGEGGVLLTQSDLFHERILCLGHFERILSLKTPAKRFAGTGFGLKHRMSPLNAAVARTQLAHLDERNRARGEAIQYVAMRLEPLGINTFLPPEGVERVYFHFMVENREEVTGTSTSSLHKALLAEGCHVLLPRYPLLHQQPLFTEDIFLDVARLRDRPRSSLPRYSAEDLPFTTAANGRMLQLPSFTRPTRALLDQYVEAFTKTLSHGERIQKAMASHG